MTDNILIIIEIGMITIENTTFVSEGIGTRPALYSRTEQYMISIIFKFPASKFFPFLGKNEVYPTLMTI